MSIQMTQVYTYLDTHPVSKYDGDFDSLLDMIHYIFTACNPINTDIIQQDFKKLGGILQSLPFNEHDVFFNTVCDLCYQHEKAAFYQGISVGMHLMTEINTLP